MAEELQTSSLASSSALSQWVIRAVLPPTSYPSPLSSFGHSQQIQRILQSSSIPSSFQDIITTGKPWLEPAGLAAQYLPQRLLRSPTRDAPGLHQPLDIGTYYQRISLAFLSQQLSCLRSATQLAQPILPAYLSQPFGNLLFLSCIL